MFHQPDDNEPPTVRDPEWPPPDRQVVRRRAAAVTQVCRLDDGTGLPRTDGLDHIGFARPYVDAAFTLLRGAGPDRARPAR
jgi:hypothetical protein